MRHDDTPVPQVFFGRDGFPSTPNQTGRLTWQVTPSGPLLARPGDRFDRPPPARKRSPASAKLRSPWSPAEAKRQGQGELFSDDLGEVPERSAERENRRLRRAAGLKQGRVRFKSKGRPCEPDPFDFSRDPLGDDDDDGDEDETPAEDKPLVGE